MRLQLLIYVRDHRDTEVVPSVTLSDLLNMAGFSSVTAYIEHMRNPQVWIDTPMLWAMAGVYNVQLVVYVGAGSPQVIIAPDAMAEHKVLTAYFGNYSNVHFWALEPDTGPPPLENPASPLDAFEDMLLPAVGAAEALDAGEAGEEQGLRTLATPLATNLSADLFAFATAMMQWDAFAAPAAHVSQLCKALEAGTADLTAQVFQVLQWRDALKLADIDVRSGCSAIVAVSGGCGCFGSLQMLWAPKGETLTRTYLAQQSISR